MQHNNERHATWPTITSTGHLNATPEEVLDCFNSVISSNHEQHSASESSHADQLNAKYHLRARGAVQSHQRGAQT